MGYSEKFELWKKRVKDRKLLRELMIMTEEEKNSAFYKDLEFGTAGIRGIMGAGTNRINIYTVRRITHGLALYMKRHDLKKAVISYDSRCNSDTFAKEAACVLGAIDVNVQIVPELMPSPFLSFATRRLGADIGIMITASHNPREYNGYKVYDSTGCQIRSEVASEIADDISKVDGFRLRMHSFDYYFKRGIIGYVSQDVEDAYLKEIASICDGRADGLSVVYTPLNGTGYRLVPKALKSIGCSCFGVPGQETPSGKFTTCPIPNPEKKEALRHGIRILKSEGADVLIATDPDADRIGIAYPDEEDARVLTGNEIGIIMSEYLLTHRQKSEVKPLIVKTIVSTDLVSVIAERNGGEVISVPTGFKYIGEVINKLEKEGEEDRFLLGFEESQGYLIGTHVRDKDAVIASKLMAIIACELKKQGKTFGDKLNEIYEKYGYFVNRQYSFAFEGREGEVKMKSLMSKLRINRLSRIGGREVTQFVDYSDEHEGLPKLDMIEYRFDGGNVIIRPSGTEPLIKIYACAHIGADGNEKLLRQIKKQFGDIFI